MTMHRDPELDDILQDDELRQIADLLRSARMPEPPLDDAFRSALRRQLMQRAWGASESRVPWWRRSFGPSRLAWTGATVGVILIGSLVVFVLNNPPRGGLNEVTVTSPIADAPAVNLQQPILVAFSQPMDHPSTEAAVQITPATTVVFSWSGNTLSVQPTSGNLAPNTQYKVTIGPGARTASGQPLSGPKTIRFVTQPAPTPSGLPTPTNNPPPTPGRLLTNEHRVANLTVAPQSTPQWSSDSSTVYFITANGALASATVADGGVPTILVPDGVSSLAIAPAGDRLAYIRGGKIEVISLGTGITTELAVTPAPSLVGWAQDKVVWAAGDGIHSQGASGSVQLAPEAAGAATVLSIAPDGTHAVYRRDQALVVLDLSTGKSTVLGTDGAQFLGWSPDGTALLYSGQNGIVVSDVHGNTTSTLQLGEPSWSSQGEILLGSGTGLFEVRPDGTGLTKLADGAYHFPAWAPNGTTFTFVRNARLFAASAAPASAPTASLDQAAAVVTAFMQARLAGQPLRAAAYLDDNGRLAYTSGGLSLLVTGDPSFSRYFILTQEITNTQPLTAQFVVRIVLAHGQLDVSHIDETLTLVASQGTGRFLIDQATAGPRRDLGRGAEVVDVHIDQHSVTVTFDSDLVPGSVIDGVKIFDSNGVQIGAAPTYNNRMVTIGSLNLIPGARYRLVVLISVQDISLTNIATEYDLQFLGPAPSPRAGQPQSGGDQPPTSSTSGVSRPTGPGSGI